jgi:catechol 2,3-dioxygenase-like lactoylglutathione lyase family enzyme
MLLYVTLGTNDIERAGAFYDRVLATLGLVRLRTLQAEIGWGAAGGPVLVWLTRPFDGRAATVGNGSMLALAAKDAAEVQAFHRAALEAGGQDEGAPGPRYRPGFYAAYVRDPDGNKLSAVHDAAPA